MQMPKLLSSSDIRYPRMSSCREGTPCPEDQWQSADQVCTCPHPHPLCQQLNPVTKSRQSGVQARHGKGINELVQFLQYDLPFTDVKQRH